ncbi:aspartate carbamoyltransferase regulatory subunit [Proteinivorax hydrogeniformans]|uniref:Aspartate carbamoyltransferase regulatory subunit n=2 Tax=Proteinivorax TaxID=1491776 RepID=A0AAU7VQ50_9FIRM
MLKVASIKNGVVIDHITPGNGLKIFSKLNLKDIDEPVILLRNADSSKAGKKDVVKIENFYDLPLEYLGILDSNITINYIKDEKIIDKKSVSLPLKIKGIVKCKNPRCISFEQKDVSPEFTLNNREDGYICSYCEETTSLKRIKL